MRSIPTYDYRWLSGLARELKLPLIVPERTWEANSPWYWVVFPTPAKPGRRMRLETAYKLCTYHGHYRCYLTEPETGELLVLDSWRDARDADRQTAFQR